MAAEFVGGALLSAFLQTAVDRLASPQVVDFFRGRKLDEKLLNKLKGKLRSINAVVDDAELKQIENQLVRDWLFEVKDVVHDAEDLLDEIDYELSRCQVEADSEPQTFFHKVPNFFNTTFSSFNRKIDSRMTEVFEKLEDLVNQKADLGLKEATYSSAGSGSKVSQKLPSTSLVVENVIYGRDDDIEMIINWLTSETNNRNQLIVLSIVGMGGVGKTTLAQHVYNDPRLEEAKFDIKAWVCVSDDFDVLTLTKTILETITKDANEKNLEVVHGRLKEELSGKRFFLVLDDVWNEDQEKWEYVKTPLSYGASGSRIIVTTRSVKVASTVQSCKVHPLKQLQEQHHWKVFAKHAFQDGHPQLDAELEVIATKIVEKCKGLPLALKTVGSLLGTKSSITEWKSVLISKIWDLPKEHSKIIPALFLSYHHLPSHLKRCFAYCALFPKDYEFKKKDLILFWMAEIFLLCPQQSKSPEELGEQYFRDLLSRSFFQRSSKSEMFVMHDLLNDLAKYVCGDICFRLGVDNEKSIPKTTRHFSIVVNGRRHFHGFGSSYDAAKRLHTFIPIHGERYFHTYWQCKIPSHELFSKFKSLYVLSLSHCSNLRDMPDSLGELKHLCSLDLSRTDIKRLPDSTCLLYNLQILKLNFCKNLEELPSRLYKLTNLRCLEFVNTKVRKMPMHLGRLKNLQVLSSFSVGKGSEFSIKQLGGLNLHGGISIGELENIVNPSDSKTHLVELKLEWKWNHIPDDPRKEKEVLENLRPSKHLKALSICNYGGTEFPIFLSSVNVVSLRLKFCKYCVVLPPFGILPFLKDLKIIGLDGIVSVGAEFYGSNSSAFTSLERLYFSKMTEWEEWECIAAFPRLQYLRIEQCPKLKGVSEQLLHAKEIVIRRCESLSISGNCMEALPLEGIGCTISNTSLVSLRILNCPNMNIPMRCCYHFLVTLNISGFHSLVTFPLDVFPKLVSLEFIGCPNLQMISQEHTHNHLKALEICFCPNVSTFMGCCYDFLETLVILDSHSLRIFPLDFFPKLYSLQLSNCCNLQIISHEHTHNHLKHLQIDGCPQLESFPSQGLFAPCLMKFKIREMENLKLLPKSMHILLPSLIELEIEDCPQVEMFSDGGLPSNLKWLSLSSFKLIASLKGALGANTCLQILSIRKMNVESFPDEGFLPLSLTSLQISNCPDLKKLDYKGLSHLSSLKELYIYLCPNLECLPEEGLPKSISSLQIWLCPLLKQRCKKPEGEDWIKIAHIKNLKIVE